MRLALEDDPTIALPVVGPAQVHAAPPPPAPEGPSCPAPAAGEAVLVLPRPGLLGPLLRALVPALAVAALIGLAARGPVGCVAGAVVAVAAVGIALRRVILVADRGY